MKTKSLNKKSGISLIVLVITIIVIIILAVAVILSIANNNPIENANKAKFQNDLKTMQEELELIKQNNYVESQGKDYGELDFDTLTGHEKYSGKFIISEGNLKYLPSKLNEKEQEWAKEIGITAGGYVLKNGSDGVKIIDGTLTTNWLDDAFGNDPATIPDGVGTDIIIPNTVTSIGDNAFEKCQQIKSVVIPSSVTSIGSNAFGYCSSITKIILPDSVTLKGGAFFGCDLVESITLPNGIKLDGWDIFCNCTSLKTVIMPEGVTSIPEETFMGCTSLTSITIPDSVTSIGDDAFHNCTNLTITISESTAKTCFGDTATEDSVKTKLGVKAVVFK